MRTQWTLSMLMMTLVLPQAAFAQAQAEAAARTAAQAQAPAGTQVQTDTRAQAQAQAATPQARIEAAMSAATRAGIPVSLLSSTVASGEARRVPQDRIAAAVEARLSALIQASNALRSAGVHAASAADLSVTGDAIQAGARESQVVRLYRSAPPERRTAAVAVMADLMRLGHPPDTAFARVDAALMASTGLVDLQADVASQMRTGGLASSLEATGSVGLSR
jgi:hypothetical protein